MRSIGILIFDGVEELDFVGPWEVFTMANNVAPKFGMDAPFAVHLIAESLTPVRCAKNMRVLPDATTADDGCSPRPATLDHKKRHRGIGSEPSPNSTHRTMPGSGQRPSVRSDGRDPADGPHRLHLAILLGT